ncbi:hypothetical protein [Pontiella sulfatireligans]|uniref:Uncharacterized protein n=1 Tax=Pontiella sulfatireligans TaxID=2750658 RepID=A0A6C2UGI9_9BACT|nr:hypothetical protein [Pontiella sulfatireligans]VGO18484.1 hypothetical protein SCARR_00537 [Pontiella sulfatireligans]
MNEAFWKNFPPIHDFDCVEMKRRAQLRIYEETRGMSPKEIVNYFKTKEESRAPIAVCETPPTYETTANETKEP